MRILDAQVHTFLADRPSRPWRPEYRRAHKDKQSFLQHAGQTNTPEMALVEMAEAGVDGAILSPIGVYGTSNEYEFEAARRWPYAFRVLGWIDHLAGDVADTVAADVERGMVGIRLPLIRERDRVARGEFDTVLAACQDLGCLVSIMLVHPMDPGLVALLRRYSGIEFVIGHLGVGVAPPVVGPMPADPFANLGAVLELAELPNVNFGLTGAPSLSREEYPFRDIWEPISRVVRAFGPDRIVWGSDYTRTNALYSHWSGVNYLRELPSLDDDMLGLIYGATLARLARWDEGRSAEASRS